MVRIWYEEMLHLVLTKVQLHSCLSVRYGLGNRFSSHRKPFTPGKKKSKPRPHPQGVIKIEYTQNSLRLVLGLSFMFLTFLSRTPHSRNGPQKIYSLYEQVSYNCFIAAGLYLLAGGFAFCQLRLNKRKEYMVR